MAISTMARPAVKPMPMLTELSARTTGTPRPLAPTSAEITTIDSDSMMVWVRPARICGMACGSSTLMRRCVGVAPKASAASMRARGVEATPRWVRRMEAGSAKITVEIRPGTMPRPNSTSAGIR